MTADPPTRVVLYSYLSGAARAVAEFRWSPGAGVTLTVLDPGQGELARTYYERGAPYDAERRAVPVGEGAMFMRALVQPTQSTYFQFVDESPSS